MTAIATEIVSQWRSERNPAFRLHLTGVVGPKAGVVNNKEDQQLTLRSDPAFRLTGMEGASGCGCPGVLLAERNSTVVDHSKHQRGFNRPPADKNSHDPRQRHELDGLVVREYAPRAKADAYVMTNPMTFHVHATLLPDGDRPLDIWISQGLLTYKPQPDAIDLKEPFVLPGLVDCHVHLTLDYGGKGFPVGTNELIEANRRSHLERGVLLLRDTGSTGAGTLNLPPGRLPSVVSAGGFLAPPGRYFEFGTFVEPEQLATVATQQVALGAQWVKIIADFPGTSPEGTRLPSMPNFASEVLASAVSAVHNAGGRVAVHCQSEEGAVMSIAAGVDSIEHGWGLNSELLQEMAERRIAWVPTLMAGRVTLDRLEREGESERRRRLEKRLDAVHQLLPMASSLGIDLLAGTDILPPGSVAQEVNALFTAGLEPREALASATTRARSFLGAESLNEGAAADLVFYQTDPRNDPLVLSEPSIVMVAGQIVQQMN